MNSDAADEIRALDPGSNLPGCGRTEPEVRFTVTVPGRVEVELHGLERTIAIIQVKTMSLLAHGTGGSTDLPIPYTYALIGAAWALTLTFALVALGCGSLARSGETGSGTSRRITALVDAKATRAVIALLGLGFTAWVLLAAIGGPQNNENALPGTFYVLLGWVFRRLPSCWGRSGGSSRHCGRSGS